MPGFTFLAIVILLFSGVQLCVLGIIGEVPFTHLSAPSWKTRIRHQGNARIFVGPCCRRPSPLQEERRRLKPMKVVQLSTRKIDREWLAFVALCWQDAVQTSGRRELFLYRNFGDLV